MAVEKDGVGGYVAVLLEVSTRVGLGSLAVPVEVVVHQAGNVHLAGVNCYRIDRLAGESAHAATGDRARVEDPKERVGDQQPLGALGDGTHLVVLPLVHAQPTAGGLGWTSSRVAGGHVH